MDALQVVQGEPYRAMHELAKPLFRARWGIGVQAVEPRPGEHWTHCKIRLLLSPSPTLLLDCDLLPTAEALWGLDPHDRMLSGVRLGGEFNTGLVFAPGAAELTHKSRAVLMRALGKTFTGPLWEQSYLQGCDWHALDPRWNALPGTGSAWGIHFAAIRDPSAKLEAMRHWAAS